MRKIFGERIKTLREINVLSKKQVAEFVGVSLQTYNKYEKGLTIPTGVKLRLFVKLYNVRCDYLLGLED